MDPFERIQAMQALLLEREELVTRFTKFLDEFEAKQDDFQRLSAYYGSGDWFSDVEAYDTNQLPEGHNYAILGEDEPYDILVEQYKLAIRMLEIATSIIKHT